MILNKTNARMLKKLFSPDDDDPRLCIGHKITLYVVSVKVGGQETTKLYWTENERDYGKHHGRDAILCLDSICIHEVKERSFYMEGVEDTEAKRCRSLVQDVES